MKDAKKIIALGIVVALVPFLGFPSSWKSVIFAILGLAIAGLSYRILARTHNSRSTEKSEEEYVSSMHTAKPAAAHE